MAQEICHFLPRRLCRELKYMRSNRDLAYAMLTA